MNPIFITGIGTGVGKTIISAIVTEAFKADYWKPIQAGIIEETDSKLVKRLVSNPVSKIHPELYTLKLAASPHIAAREEGIKIDLERILNSVPATADRLLVIEGAGGLLVPLNNDEFVIDLIKKLDAKVILVSRNYLGSINHSLLTATACKLHNIEVLGWVFNDEYLDYEEEIVRWSGYKKICSIPNEQNINHSFIQRHSVNMRKHLEVL
jgi:dethiobiotin synthetase